LKISDYVRFWKMILRWLKLEFSIDYDRAKCPERVSKNDIKNGLTLLIFPVKT